MAKAYNNRGIAYLNTRQTTLAIQDFSKAISLESNHAQYFFNRASAFIQAALFDKAVSDYTQAVTINPDYGPAFFNRGILRIHLGNKNMGCYDLSIACDLGIGCDRLEQMQRMNFCHKDES
jgi:tetratricopeptide (TPR) repeat protein